MGVLGIQFFSFFGNGRPVLLAGGNLLHLLFDCHWFPPKNGLMPFCGVLIVAHTDIPPSFSWSTVLAYWEFLASSPPCFLWEWQTCTAGRRQVFSQSLTLTSQFLLQYFPSLLGVLGIQFSLFSLGIAAMYCWQKAVSLPNLMFFSCLLRVFWSIVIFD